MSIVLCGFMGCGKSTVGRLIADRLKMRLSTLMSLSSRPKDGG